MTLWIRAAGISAAVLGVAAGLAAAQPTLALDYAATSPAPRYIDHAAATLNAAALPSDTVEDVQPGAAADFATPVDQHAAATIASDGPEQPAPDKPAATLAELVVDHADAETDGPQQQCLAQAVYFEAKGEPLEGQLAVAEVIMNRAASGRFPSSLCGVVKQKSQFSFVRGGHIPAAPTASAAWRKAVAIAEIAMNDLAESRSSRALFFHARSTAPRWRGVSKVAAIGNHIFYR